MHIVVLETALFPDRETVEAALTSLTQGPTGHHLSRWDLRHGTLSAGQWDTVLDAVLAGDLVVTV